MRGWATYNKPFTQANRAEAKSLFEKALATDPLSTEAMIGFVAAVAGNLTSGWPNTPEDIEKAEQLITQALHMQPDNALAHFAAGRLHRGLGRLVEAAQEQKVAFRLNPNDANVNNELAVVLNFLGRPLESLAYNEQAIRLNPLDPFRSTMLWAKGYSYLILGRFKEAIEALEQANSVNSKLWYVHLDWSSALAMDGRIGDARKEFAEHLRLRPDIITIERIGVVAPWILTLAQHWQMRDQTLNEGLRRIGVPER
jgi:tetratricopeptide (TPR) repeat protein